VNLALHVAFNLLANSIGSFLLALGLVLGAIAVFRIGVGRVRLALLTLPFVKVLWDAAAGIPSDSFLWEKARGAHQDLGVFRIGLGFTRFSPQLTAELGALFHGQKYTESVAELIDTGLSRYVASQLPAALVVGWVLATALLLCRRLLHWWQFARAMRRLRASARLCEHRLAAGRAVAIYLSDEYAGAPFASGWLHAYVMLPRESWCKLTQEQRDAVLLHELSHIEHQDLLLDGLLQLLSDVLWFLPAGAWLLRRIRTELELRADEAALAKGADRIGLAAALVCVAETLHAPSHGIGLLPVRSALTWRVQQLVAASASSARWGYGHPFGRILILIFLLGAVLQSGFFGNHSATLLSH
jgi:beta-lactamase regulating signal transducer with metallopeptidase domain